MRSKSLREIRTMIVFLADAVDRMLVSYQNGDDIPFVAEGVYHFFQDIIEHLDTYEKEKRVIGGLERIDSVLNRIMKEDR